MKTETYQEIVIDWDLFKNLCPYKVYDMDECISPERINEGCGLTTCPKQENPFFRNLQFNVRPDEVDIDVELGAV